jgi:hypothetical protein
VCGRSQGSGFTPSRSSSSCCTSPRPPSASRQATIVTSHTALTSAAASSRPSILLFGAAAFQHSVLNRTSDHRRHHLNIDEGLDPYNIKRGFLWAHIGWLTVKQPNPEDSPTFRIWLPIRRSAFSTVTTSPLRLRIWSRVLSAIDAVEDGSALPGDSTCPGPAPVLLHCCAIAEPEVREQPIEFRFAERPHVRAIAQPLDLVVEHRLGGSRIYGNPLIAFVRLRRYCRRCRSAACEPRAARKGVLS